MEYEVNKGIGKEVEFKGLTSSYLFIFAAGLLITFFIVIVIYMAGVNPYACIIFGLVAATLVVWITFNLNKHYGAHGLIKIAARNKRPLYISSRVAIFRLFKIKQHEK